MVMSLEEHLRLRFKVKVKREVTNVMEEAG